MDEIYLTNFDKYTLKGVQRKVDEAMIILFLTYSLFLLFSDNL